MRVCGDESHPSLLCQLNENVLDFEIPMTDAVPPKLGEQVEKRQNEVSEDSLLQLIVIR